LLAGNQRAGLAELAEPAAVPGGFVAEHPHGLTESLIGPAPLLKLREPEPLPLPLNFPGLGELAKRTVQAAERLLNRRT
jgi:hypothetical protein